MLLAVQLLYEVHWTLSSQSVSVASVQWSRDRNRSARAEYVVVKQLYGWNMSWIGGKSSV